MTQLDIAGFVLAGGASRRFGSNKAVALHEGRRLLEYPLRALRKLGFTPRIVCRDPAPLAWCSAPFVMGERPGMGPVEGLRAALASGAHDWALVLAVDMPEVGELELRALLKEAGSLDAPRAVCFAEEGGRRHPFPGVYHRSLLAELGGLDAPRAMQTLLENTGAGASRFLTPTRPAALVNLNRPAAAPRPKSN